MKSERYSVEKFKALGDITRLRVVSFMFHVDGLSSWRKDIKKIARCENTLLSHHLSVLKRAGIVFSTRMGKRVHYTLKDVDFVRKVLG
jgi:DNA-binding transcriptional ArsR family regulator